MGDIPESNIESAPVESAPSEAAQVSAPPAVDSAPVEAAQEASSAPEVSKSPPVPSFSYPSTEDFKFKDWNGKVEEFPEDSREFISALWGHHDKSKQAHLSELSDLRALWESKEDDPRVAELTNSSSEWEAKYNELTTKSQQREESIEAAIKADVDRYEERFRRRHPDLFTNPKLGKTMSALLTEGWEPEAAAELAKNPALKAAAVNFKLRGTPDELAVDLARGQVEGGKSSIGVGSKPTPRPAAAKVAGVQGARSASSVEGLGKQRSWETMRDVALNRAQKRFNLPD